MLSDTRFSTPLYTAALAASHLGLSPSTLNRWLNKDALLTAVSGPSPRAPRLPFIGLVEAQFYRELRRAGLSMQAITSGMKVVRRELGVRMLVKGVIAHDGKDLLMNLAERGDPEWERARDRQLGLRGIIDIGLKPIVWGDDGLPIRLRLTAYGDTPVVADPAYAFGQPIVETSGARVEDILSMFKAGEKLVTVASEMGVTSEDVESIVRTHLTLAA
ncbi:MAG: DUF433 domain-containing protein [Propionibacteriaceae bacterium]|jgi:uncharacterized protein (DUF433 family)|nr:DUF433 domain-containing protein [Propionibacteriaceae bacterium]